MKKLFLLFYSTSLLLLLSIQSILAYPFECRYTYYTAARGDFSWRDEIKFVDSDGDIVEFNYNNGGGGSIAFGKNFNAWRFEIEGALRYNRISDALVTLFEEPIPGGTGYVRDFMLTFNGFYDIKFPESFYVFYIGGGLGATFEHRKFAPLFGDVQKRHETLFIWQGMAGYTYEVCQYVNIDIGYRIIGIQKPKSSKGERAQSAPLMHNIEVGIRIDLL